MGLIPVSGRSPEVGNGNSSILAWRISWTEEPGGLQSRGSQTDMTEHAQASKQALLLLDAVSFFLLIILIRKVLKFI